MTREEAENNANTVRNHIELRHETYSKCLSILESDIERLSKIGRYDFCIARFSRYFPNSLSYSIYGVEFKDYIIAQLESKGFKVTEDIINDVPFGWTISWYPPEPKKEPKVETYPGLWEFIKGIFVSKK